MKKIALRMISVLIAAIMVIPHVSNSLVVNAAETDTSTYADFSPYIVEKHPRLYVTSFEGLKEKYLSDPQTASWYNSLLAEATVISDGAVTEYDLEKLTSSTHIRRIIPSQDILDRFYCLAFAAACEDSKVLANRLWQEVDAAINLPNWHPGHWLETAEMMHSVAIAYDWCYKFWTQEQKDLMEEAIINLGLSHAIREYAGNRRWYKWVYGMDGLETGTNWTVVCNAGVLIASLALYGEYGGYEEYFKTTSSETHNNYMAPYIGKESEFCNIMINNAVRSMKAGTNAYSANGAYRESFAYWNYATRNLIMATDAFESAIGGDFNKLPEIEAPFTYDFSLAPGISITPDFPIYANGPAGVFNYGDASGGSAVSSPAFMWIGNRFDTPHYTKYHLDNLEAKGVSGENIPLDLLWYDGGEKEKSLAQDRLFENDFASMRSSWNDDDAVYITLKGGTNGRAHQHYDIGTFVLDAFGTRFARTLGAIGYDWDGDRSQFYKGRTEGQNTMVINPDESVGQYTSGTSEFESFYSGTASAYAILDMTGAYDKAVKSSGGEYITADTAVTSARRGIKMYSDKTRIVVQDEVTMSEPSEYYWFMHTDANISLYNNNKSAVLTLGGKSVYMNVVSDSDAVFETMTAGPLPTSPDPEDQTGPYGTKLAIHLEDITSATVAVEIIPSLGTEPVYSGYITPLDEWHPENDVTRFGRELIVYGDDKAGRTATMLVKSPLGNIYGIDQGKADSKGEYVFDCFLPENYENGIYSVYLNGMLYKTFEVTDGIEADVPSVSYTISYDLPDGVSSSVLVAAEYKNECMVQYTSAPYSTASSSATVNFDFNPSNGSTIKFFYLESLENIIPLYPATELVVN